MGGVIALLLLILLFAGAISLWMKILDALRGKRPTPRKRPQGPSEGPSYHLRTFVQALENEGYMGNVALLEGDMEYVDDPVLSNMLTVIARERDLLWALPPLRLRLKATPQSAPEAFKRKYQWVVMTPTHVIGYK